LNFHSAPWRTTHEQGGRIVAQVNDGVFEFDFAIAGTGSSALCYILLGLDKNLLKKAHKYKHSPIDQALEKKHEL
jgi:hypothetical protein